ncbi:helix-turn-helix domain-containing protein [Phyllobacterium endophyticum]|uniref:helix-turn-helix domain-containing protein n=1 Tax=Phyllobacterium endophyticum TaxID=1149773 RepID=UPI0011C8E167|nr:helix-turn-helix transcriptional regulator [Phyllobacterium endophyticum]
MRGGPSWLAAQNPKTNRKNGERPRELRLLVGMTQQSLGAIIDVSYVQIQQYENGKNRAANPR